MIRRLLLIFAAILLGAVPTRAQFGGDFFDYDGYVKYLFSSYETGSMAAFLPDASSVPDRLNEHLIHARLNTHWYFTNNFRGEMAIRARAFYGGAIEYVPGYYESIRSRHNFDQLDWKMWDDDRTIGYAQIDRLYLDYTMGDMQTTVGRQRIAWGTAYAWNIIDVFNPKDVLDFDYEELPGADAVRVQYYTGAVTKVEAAYKPGDSWDETTLGALWSMNQWDYDFHLIAGARNGVWFGGGAWVGDIADAGFRGEVIAYEAPKHAWVSSGRSLSTNHFLQKDEVAFSAVVSGDYTFENSLNLTAEVLFNSYGVTEDAALYAYDAQYVGLLSPSRWSTYFAAGYDFHPLVRGTAFAIYNPVDGSVLAAPQVSWSALTNFDVMAVAFFTAGNALTEFGGYGNFYFLRGKWSF